MKRIIPLILIFTICLSSCNVKKIAEILNTPLSGEKYEKEEEITLEESRRRVDLYWAVLTYNLKDVRKYLEEGYDPNKSIGEEGWMVRTPLSVVARNFFSTYERIEIGETIPEPHPDIEIINLLVNAGADVNNRPYIWNRIYVSGNYHIERTLNNKLLSHNSNRPRGTKPRNEEEVKELEKENMESVRSFINDVNRVLKAFIEAGADPDMRGHPYPYTKEATRARITDKKANEYFAKGTRPINEVIKKGMWWESQVDLLLQYTTLDEDSLAAAKESKDPAMIEKINRLWKEQNAR